MMRLVFVLLFVSQGAFCGVKPPLEFWSKLNANSCNAILSEMRLPLKDTFHPKTSLGSWALEKMAEKGMEQAPLIHLADALTSDLSQSRVKESLQEVLLGFRESDIDAALLTVYQKGIHGKPESDEELLQLAAARAFFPVLGAAFAASRWIDDHPKLDAINQHLKGLVDFYRGLVNAYEAIGEIQNPHRETLEIRESLARTIQSLRYIDEMTEHPKDGIVDRINRLLDGDIKTGFRQGLSSSLDNKRRLVGLWENNSGALLDGLLALTVLDVYGDVETSPSAAR